MEAIVYSNYGSPDVLQIAEVPKPAPKDGEVLIRVRAAEATKSDCEMRSFKYSVKWFWLPLRLALGVRKPRRRILGGYLAGEIVSTGKDVTRFLRATRFSVPLLCGSADTANTWRYRRAPPSSPSRAT